MRTLFQQGHKCWVDMGKNFALHRGNRMQTIGLKSLTLPGNRRQQKWQQGDFLLFGDDNEGLLKIVGLHRAVVGRHAHADQQDASLGSLGQLDHGGQIVLHLCYRQAAQAIVGTQCEYHYLGFELA